MGRGGREKGEGEKVGDGRKGGGEGQVEKQVWAEPSLGKERRCTLFALLLQTEEPALRRSSQESKRVRMQPEKVHPYHPCIAGVGFWI